MFSLFFINRPIFASVIAIVTIVAGTMAFFALPVAQYPEITPPTVQVTAIYPGANAVTIAETVGAAIEQEVNGVEGMIYMSSVSSNSGTYSLDVTFEVGTDLDMAQVLVQNRVAAAEPGLPEEVKRQGVMTNKKSPSILFMVSLFSPTGDLDGLYLSNYALMNIVDELRRVTGVGDVSVFGSGDYSMRIWLDPNQLKARDLTTQDVVNAIRDQNVQVAAGQIGAPPAPEGQAFQYTVNTQGRFTTLEEFENIILRADGNRITRVRDVARVELGAMIYDNVCELGGQPSAGIAIYQLPGSNALDLSADIKAKMEEMKSAFPEGMDYTIPYDTTLFVKSSIDEVYITLFQAALLVVLVLFLFLQDWRATIIPVITIPVSLIGTLAVLAAIGYSLNLLTLFGLILAIGIVVDDAIVVVENVWKHLETGMSPREATIKAMSEISGAIIATTLVLLAVFIPSAFLPGITGQMYSQFAVTIAVSTVISSINALTLSPALSAILLRPPSESRFFLFKAFNAIYLRSENLYAKILNMAIRLTVISLIFYLGFVALAGLGFTKLPTGFLPTEDQGVLLVMAQLPDAASLERTQLTLDRIDGILENTPGVSQFVSIAGFSLLDKASASNTATYFVSLKPWDERTDDAESLDGIVGHLRREFAQIQEAVAFPIIPPSINGLGAVGGFQMMLQSKGGSGLEALEAMTAEMTAAARQHPILTGVNSTFRANVPQIFIDINRTQAMTLGIPMGTVFSTLQSYLGSAYVNDFSFLGKTYQVRVQAESQYRMRAEDIGQLQVRNLNGEMIPLSTLVDVQETVGPQNITRYNLYPSASITGGAVAGQSSGQALLAMEALADQILPSSMGYEWTGMSYQERLMGSEAVIVFALAVLLVFLVLSAQYESWTAPMAIVLAVPLGLLGTVWATSARGMDNNVYTQIGILLIIGLASKSAILIVEFARELRMKEKQGLVESAKNAARLRFRAILMTVLSFVLGIMPLLIASGAGAASRRALGTTVFGGMIAATALSVIFVPIFYIVLQGGSERFASRGKAPADESVKSDE